MRQAAAAVLPLMMALAAGALAPHASAQATGPARTAQEESAPVDWIEAADPHTRRLIPHDGALSLDNPPVISAAPHPRRRAGSVYTLWLQGPDGSLRLGAEAPRWLPDQALPEGQYRWQVEVLTEAGVQRSAPRHFRIGAGTDAPCPLPDAATVLATLQRRTPPRLLPQDMSVLQRRWAGEQAHEWRVYQGAVRADIGLQPLRTDIASIEQAAHEALAWRYDGGADLADSARRKLLAIAAWPQDDDSHESRDDQRNRALYLSLARGADLLAGRLEAADLERLRTAAQARLAQYVREHLDSGAFDERPYRSHAANAMNHALEAAALLAGHSADADRLFATVWQAYRTLYPVWGAQDGSDASGTGYGWTNLLQPPQAWLALRHAAGVDLACRAHARRAGLQPVYFTPPARPASRGATAGPWPVFGDGADRFGDYVVPAHVEREFALYTTLVDQPLYDWYLGEARRLMPRALRDRIRPKALAAVLRAPRAPTPREDLPAGTPNGLAFQESGAVALHSALEDPQRLSLYFMSGRFGSFNHAKPEHNGFVLTRGGEPLLMAAGYFQDSAHGRLYARRTLAANAITFDGGIGQGEDAQGRPVDSMHYAGRLVATGTEGEILYASGDATQAYRRHRPGQAPQPLLTRAWRSVALLPAFGVALVYDRLSSATPRRWEWHVHAPTAFELAEDGAPSADPAGTTAAPRAGPSVIALAGRERVCIDWHGDATEFTHSSRFPIEPEGRAAREPPQAHGRFRVRTPSTEATFLAVLRLDCQAPRWPVAVDRVSGSARIGVPQAGDPDGRSRSVLSFDGLQVHQHVLPVHEP